MMAKIIPFPKMTEEEFCAKMNDKWWRMNHLYYIIDKQGNRVLFKCNEAQEYLYKNQWYMNLILKDRQRGMTTFIDLYILDDVLWYPDLEAGIIAHKEADAIKIFRRKIKYPYEQLPDFIRDRRPLLTKRTDELAFPNNSYVYVSTSMRSGTVQRLHLSEFGKVCAKYPEKAREIVSGSLEAVHPGAIVWIESTAEGREGYFYNYCQDALNLQQSHRKPTKLEFKLFFYGWTEDKDKQTSEPVPLTTGDHQYFTKIERELGVELTDGQKWWYSAKKKIQREEMFKENPATIAEAFAAAVEGSYYATDIAEAREQGRITVVPHIDGITVDTWWDLGYDDSTSIWFTQTVGREIHIISYYEAHGEGLLHYGKTLDSMAREGGWMYGYHTGPHDTMKHELGPGKTIMEQGRDLVDPVTKEKYSINFTVAKRIENQQEGIEAVRSILPYCWFDEEKTTITLGNTSREKLVGLPSLENYRREYDEKWESFKKSPLHNWASHGSKAFETMAISHSFGAHENNDLRSAFG